MTSHGMGHWSISRRIALLVILCLLGMGLMTPCRAEGPVHYFAKQRFVIPFSLPTGRVFKQMHLHASTDRKTYSRVGSTAQREGEFEYTARGDGWYYFILQVEELDGTFTPRSVQLSPPGMRVCIDSQKPVATLKAVTPKEGRAAVEWAVSDPNLNLQTLRLEYRTVGAAQWIGLKHLQLPRAQFNWNPSGAGPYEVRLTVKDLAENETQVTTQVKPDVTRSATGTGTSGAAEDRKVIYVPKKTFKLTYNVEGAGPSSVKHVEVWVTRDTSQWTRHSGNAPPTGPFEVTMPQTGRYGFTLRPVSGVGRGPKAPEVGDLPQIWIEVDEKAPEVQLHNVIVGEGMESGTITVNWRASDKFFGDAPITLYYADVDSVEWKVLKEKVENTGTCRCETKGLPFQFRLRVEAVDLAGNRAHADSTDTIKVDLAIPKISEVGVQVGGGGAGPGANPPR